MFSLVAYSPFLTDAEGVIFNKLDKPHQWTLWHILFSLLSILRTDQEVIVWEYLSGCVHLLPFSQILVQEWIILIKWTFLLCVQWYVLKFLDGDRKCCGAVKYIVTHWFSCIPCGFSSVLQGKCLLNIEIISVNSELYLPHVSSCTSWANFEWISLQCLN